MVKINQYTLKQFQEYINEYLEVTEDPFLFVGYFIFNLFKYGYSIGEIREIIAVLDKNIKEHEIINYLDGIDKEDSFNLNKIFPTIESSVEQGMIIFRVNEIFKKPLCSSEAERFADEERLNIPDYSPIMEPQRIDTKLGSEFISNLSIDFSKFLEDIFEELSPGNGKLGVLMWSSAVATVKGKPNIVIIHGNPGEGKTVLMEYVLRFIPDKYIIRLNKSTIASLLTRTHTEGNDYLDGKIVYLGDLGSKNAWEESEETRIILRTLLTDGHWARELTDQQDIGGKTEKAVLREELIGYPTMWFTTVKADAEDQDKDRSIIATTNLDKEKDTIDIIQHLANKLSKTSNSINSILEENIPVIHSVLELLVQSDDEVVLPWRVAELKLGLRDSKRVVDLTSMLALINKDNRRRYGSFILPNEKDITNILDLLDKGTGKLPELTIKRLHQIYVEFKDETFTRNDVMSLKGFSDAYSKADKMAIDILNPAIREGFIEEDAIRGSRGAKRYRFIEEPQPTLRLHNLPPIDLNMLENEYGKYEISDPLEA